MRSGKIIGIALTTLMILLGACTKNQEEQNFPESTEVVVVLNNLSETYSYYMPETNNTIIDVDTTGAVPNDILIYGDYAYIVNSGFGGVPSLMKIELLKDTMVKYTVFPNGSNPWAVIKKENSLFVSCTGNDMAYKLDLYTLRFLDSVKVGKGPEGMTEKDGRIYVACTGYDLSNYSYNNAYVYTVEEGPEGLYVSDSVYAGVNTQSVAIVSDTLYALSTGDYTNTFGKLYLYEIGDSLRFVDTINVGQSPGYMYYYNNALYLTDWYGGVCKVSTQDREVIWQNTGEGTSQIAIDMNGIGFITRFNASGPNYLLLFDPERVQVYDSVYMGERKGIQGLGIWMKTQ